MNDQLQDLLSKVYEEGVAKANAEADKILEHAKAEAEKIISKAKSQAEATTLEAEKKAKELQKNTEGDLKMAGNHTLSALKQKITDLVLSVSLDKATKSGFEDPDFVKGLIRDTLAGWKQDASITVAESLKAKLDEGFISSLNTAFANKLEIDFSPQIKAGFTISPTDGSYKLSFTDQDFSELFKTYLRPRTAKILFDS
jgi:V/A-type H+-transporting ATPase subunit E